MPKRISPDNRLKVFFSAPTPDNKDQSQLYISIRDAILKTRSDITYDWLVDFTDYESESVTQKSLAAIKVADVLISETTIESIGVGQQIAYARSNKIPVILLQLESNKNQPNTPSIFNFGQRDPEIHSYTYTPKTIYSVLIKALKKIGHERFVKFNFISTPEINSVIEEKSQALGISKSHLLRNIIEHWQKSHK